MRLLVKLGLLVVIAVVLFLPYPFEVGGEFTLSIDKYLTFDFGASFARLGDFYGAGIPRGIYEIFSRFQIEF